MSNPYDVIVVYNPTNVVQQAVYNSEIYAVIQPNQTARIPRFVADLYVKHTVDYLIQNNDPAKSILDPELRTKYTAMVVRKQEIYKTPEPVMMDKYDDKKQDIFISDLDRITIPEGITNDHDFSEPTVPEPTIINEPVVTVNKYPKNPTKEQVLDYAKNVSFLDLNDEKTKASIENMDLDTLIKEVGYESDEL